MTTKPPSKTSRSKTVPSPRLPPEQVHQWLDDLFADDLHAKRVLSLSHGVVGIIAVPSIIYRRGITRPGRGEHRGDGVDPLVHIPIHEVAGGGEIDVDRHCLL